MATRVITAAELKAPYRYVISEHTISDVDRLLLVDESVEGGTSAIMRALQTHTTGSILRLQGLGSEIWDDVDPKQYIDELRDEWKHR